MKVSYPKGLLTPVQKHLKKEEEKLKNQKKSLDKEDPFNIDDRVLDNAAVDADAAEEVGHERVSALKKEIDRNLIRIRKALTRIKLGNYGLCSICGKMIDTDRLAANPTADKCIVCQNRQAKKA